MDAGRAADNPFASPTTTARGPRLRPGRNRYAGFWWRALAMLIDGLVLVPATLVAQANKRWWHQPAIAITSLLVYPIYKIAMEARGGTVGKRACGIMVIDAAARHPGVARSLSRNWPFVLGNVANAALVVTAGNLLTAASLRDPAQQWRALVALAPNLLIWLFMLVDAAGIGLSRQKRALHDRWAGTWCIRPRTAADDER
jgi:uncharacterized RDD family membrane protein YckC